MQSLVKDKRDVVLVLALSMLSAIVYLLPTGFEERVDESAVRCRGQIVEVDTSEIRQFAMVKTGDQTVTVQLLDGPFEGRTVQANNPLLGQMDKDKIFVKGDVALMVLTVNDKGEIIFANPQDHSDT